MVLVLFGATTLFGLIGAAVPKILGFGATIAAKSFAAAWLASIGNVLAGSLFALVQSCAATGWLTWISGSIFASIAALFTVTTGFL